MQYHPLNKKLHYSCCEPFSQNSTKKKVWVVQKYERNKRCHAKEALAKKRKERKKEKIVHTFENSKRERGMTLEYTKIQKYFTHLHNLEQNV
jgi:hypothetical protein